MKTSIQNSFRCRKKGKKGMTLVEVLVALGITTIVLGGAATLLITGANFASYNQGKLLVNRDIRDFTSELADNAIFANYFIIYQSFTDRSILNDGLSGDFLLLVYRDPDAPERTERLVGYYRSAGANAEGPVRKFDLAFSPSSSADVDTLLPSKSTEDDHPEVIELSKGLSDGRLFYNFYDRSIMVRGEILHKGSLKKRATNTYNFTVSPRG